MPPRHVLLPRARGFVASVQGLGGHVAAVYDVTIGYVDGLPSLWQWAKGQMREVHIHVRRHALTDLPPPPKPSPPGSSSASSRKTNASSGSTRAGRWRNRRRGPLPCPIDGARSPG